MGQKRLPGLIKRGSIWHINKKIKGRRISESTRSSSLKEAEYYLARRIDEVRQASIYGIRPKRCFREAAIKFLKENSQKKSLYIDARLLKKLDHFIGHLPIKDIHSGSLANYIKSRQQEGVKNRTVNYGLQVIRRILNLAAQEWVDNDGLSWLAIAPKIRLLPETQKRLPYPLNKEEEDRLLNALPLHLRRMALFAVNTGCRDQEICRLQWCCEVAVPELNTHVFIIPARHVKNRRDRLVVLNNTAINIINECKGLHPSYVFTYRGKPITRILNSAWRQARIKVNLPQVRVHDLKHTFGRRLRAVHVSFEDRQDLLGHQSQRITTYYSAAELKNLIQAANKVCDEVNSTPILTILRKANPY